MASRTLTDLAAKKAKPKDKPYKLGAGSGLYLEVMPNGSKYWRLKYRVAGREKRLALGVYSVEVDAVNSSGSVLDSLNSAIDVSSSWTKFPRYGYVADYPSTLSTADAWHDMWLLKNYHIHGVQFYDWQWKHHVPLAGSVSAPAASWQSINGGTNYASAVNSYIQAAHS